MSQWPTIPGETPIDDISGLKIKSVRTRAALNVVEAENIRTAMMKYLASKPTRRQVPFDLHWLKMLHRSMFGRVWSWAGEIRTTDLNLGTPHSQVEAHLQHLLGDLEYWERNGLPLIEQAAMLHHRAVQIHPFLNGNGRWARMMANIWLKLHDCSLTNWPEESIGGESTIRQEYLAAIKAADDGDCVALIALHQRYTPDAR